MAEIISDSTAPIATVEPMAFSTGDADSDSSPNAITVESAANSSDRMVRSRSAPGAWRSKNSE